MNYHQDFENRERWELPGVRYPKFEVTSPIYLIFSVGILLVFYYLVGG